MKKDLSAMGLHLLAGIIIGYASFLVAPSVGAPAEMKVLSAALAVAAAFLLRALTASLFKEKEFGWWLGNGAIIYLFTWLITWLVFLNL